MKRQLSALAFCAGLVLTDRLIAAWPNAETGLIAVSCALVLAGIAGLTRGGNPSGSLLAYLATAVVVIRLDKFFVSLSWLLPAGRGHTASVGFLIMAGVFVVDFGTRPRSMKWTH